MSKNIKKVTKPFVILLLLAILFTILAIFSNSFLFKAAENDVTLTNSNNLIVKKYVAKNAPLELVNPEGNEYRLDSAKDYLIRPKDGYSLLGYTFVNSASQEVKADEKVRQNELTVNDERYYLVGFSQGSIKAIVTNKIYVDVVNDGNKDIVIVTEKESTATDQEKILNSVSRKHLSAPAVQNFHSSIDINLVINKNIKIIFTDKYLKTKTPESKRQNIIKNIFVDEKNLNQEIGGEYSFDGITFEIGEISNEQELEITTPVSFKVTKLFKNNIKDSKIGKTTIKFRKNLTINSEKDSSKLNIFDFEEVGNIDFEEIVNLKIGNYFLVKARSETVDNYNKISIQNFDIKTAFATNNNSVGSLFDVKNTILNLGNVAKKSTFTLDKLATDVEGGFININQYSGLNIENVDVILTKNAFNDLSIVSPIIHQNGKIDTITMNKYNDFAKTSIKNLNIKVNDVDKNNLKNKPFKLVNAENIKEISIDLDSLEEDYKINLEITGDKINIKNIKSAYYFLIKAKTILPDSPSVINIENVKFNNNSDKSVLLNVINSNIIDKIGFVTPIAELNIKNSTTFESEEEASISVGSLVKVNLYNLITDIQTGLIENGDPNHYSALKFYGLKASNNKYQAIKENSVLVITTDYTENSTIYWKVDVDKKIYSKDLKLQLSESDNLIQYLKNNNNAISPFFQKNIAVEIDIESVDKLVIPFLSEVTDNALLKYGTDWSIRNISSTDLDQNLVNNFIIGPAEPAFLIGIQNGKSVGKFSYILNSNIEPFKMAVYIKDGDNYIVQRNIILANVDDKYKIGERKLLIRQNKDINVNIGTYVNISLDDGLFSIYNGDSENPIADLTFLMEPTTQKLNLEKLYGLYPELRGLRIKTVNKNKYLPEGTYDLSLDRLNSIDTYFRFEFADDSGKVNIVENVIELTPESYEFYRYVKNEDTPDKVKEINKITLDEFNEKQYSGEVYLVFLRYEGKLHILDRSYKTETNHEFDLKVSKEFYNAGYYRLEPKKEEGYKFIGTTNLDFAIKRKLVHFDLSNYTYNYKNSKEFTNKVDLNRNSGLNSEIAEIIEKPQEVYGVKNSKVLEIQIITLFEDKNVGKNKKAQISINLVGENANNFELYINLNGEAKSGYKIEFEATNLEIQKKKVQIKVKKIGKITIPFAIQSYDAVRKKDNLQIVYKEDDIKYNVLETLDNLRGEFRDINSFSDYQVDGAYDDFELKNLEFSFADELVYLNNIDLNERDKFKTQDFDHLISVKTYKGVILVKNTKTILDSNPNYEVEFIPADLEITPVKLDVKIEDITPYYLETNQTPVKYSANSFSLNYNKIFKIKLYERRGNTEVEIQKEDLKINKNYIVELISQDINYIPKNTKLGFRVTKAKVDYKFRNRGLRNDNYILLTANEIKSLTPEKLFDLIKKRIIFLDNNKQEIKDKLEDVRNIALFEDFDRNELNSFKKIDKYDYLNGYITLNIYLDTSKLSKYIVDNFNLLENTRKLNKKNIIEVVVNIKLDSFISQDKKVQIKAELIDTKDSAKNTKTIVISKDTIDKKDYKNLMKNIKESMQKDMKSKQYNKKSYKSKKFSPTSVVNVSFNEDIFKYKPEEMIVDLGKKSLNKNSIILYVDSSVSGSPIYRKLSINKDYKIDNGKLIIKNTEKVENSLSGKYIIGQEKSKAGTIILIIFILISLGVATYLVIKFTKKKKKNNKK